jgi:hypothetical protein
MRSLWCHPHGGIVDTCRIGIAAPDEKNLSHGCRKPVISSLWLSLDNLLDFFRKLIGGLQICRRYSRSTQSESAVAFDQIKMPAWLELRAD